MSKALVFLAEGFEEIEAISIIDILRRGSVEVQTASITGSLVVKGAHGVGVEADSLANDAVTEQNLASFDVVVLPGGLPGTDYLNESPDVKKALEFQNQQGKQIAAICAAPKVLCDKGIVEGKNITHYPGCVENYNGANYDSESKVVVDGNVTTSQGPGTAVLFGLQIVENLKGAEAANTLASQVLVSR